MERSRGDGREEGEGGRGLFPVSATGLREARAPPSLHATLRASGNAQARWAARSGVLTPVGGGPMDKRSASGGPRPAQRSTACRPACKAGAALAWPVASSTSRQLKPLQASIMRAAGHLNLAQLASFKETGPAQIHVLMSAAMDPGPLRPGPA